jgi:hypothetical protein
VWGGDAYLEQALDLLGWLDASGLKATPAAFHMTFFGTQPTFTHVPPKRPGSITAALAPYSAARCAQASPPLPPPTLMRSKA